MSESGTGYLKIARRRTGAVAAFRQIWVGSKSTIVLIGFLSAFSGVVQGAMLVALGRTATLLGSGTSSIGFTLFGRDYHLSISVGLMLVAGLGVLALILEVLVSRISAQASARQLFDSRTALLRGFLDAEWAVVAGEREGHLQDLLTVYATRQAQGVFAAGSVVSASLNFFVLVALALFVNPLVALGLAVSALCLGVALRPLVRATRRSAHAEANLNLDFGSAVAETVNLARDLRTFGTEEARLAELTAQAAEVSEPYSTTQFLARLVPSLYQLATIWLAAAGIGLAYVAGRGGLAGLAAVVLLLLRAFMYSQHIQSFVQQLTELAPYSEGIVHALEEYTRKVYRRDGDPLPRVESLEFTDVSFAHDESAPVLKGLTLRCEPHQILGISGPSGSGKTTLTSLLLRFVEPTEGEYFVNDVAASRWDHASFARRIAYVPQDARLLRGSVRENIRFCREWLEANALDHALERTKLGIELGDRNGNVSIAERGRAISGGQRVRVALARAFAGRPDVLILDEPTSALDPESADIVHASIREARDYGAIVIVVSHRAETLQICDRVLDLEPGGGWSCGLGTTAHDKRRAARSE